MNYDKGASCSLFQAFHRPIDNLYMNLKYSKGMNCPEKFVVAGGGGLWWW